MPVERAEKRSPGRDARCCQRCGSHRWRSRTPTEPQVKRSRCSHRNRQRDPDGSLPDHGRDPVLSRYSARCAASCDARRLPRVHRHHKRGGPQTVTNGAGVDAYQGSGAASLGTESAVHWPGSSWPAWTGEAAAETTQCHRPGSLACLQDYAAGGQLEAHFPSEPPRDQPAPSAWHRARLEMQSETFGEHAVDLVPKCLALARREASGQRRRSEPPHGVKDNSPSSVRVNPRDLDG